MRKLALTPACTANKLIALVFLVLIEQSLQRIALHFSMRQLLEGE
ncbi:hypothetical protein AEST_03900 [Alishewanella aestuarii B11]|uniref:Uncharacterized protein n=1 Tax=Alishewanella aestuarii B11 TaxID=1197174 RepID=J2IJ75_9ALTE|nr:hypothetical protein AEST_03900 [Alishewanella aestuarii B11]